MVRGAVAVPVNSKLLIVVPPRYKLLNGSVLDPKSMFAPLVNKLVLIATLVRLDSSIFAPPPAIPRQLPVVKQTVPLIFGRVIVVLEFGDVKTSDEVNPETVSDNSVLAPTIDVFCTVFPTVRLELGLISVIAFRDVISEFAPAAA